MGEPCHDDIVAGYKVLLTFKQCTEIFDLTFQFCQKFLPGREMLRQRDQMNQAARSSKQCIAEGATQGTSLKGYIKMLGISRGSFPSYPVNYMIDLITRTNYLLDRQKKSLEEKFIKEGGYTEKLHWKRVEYRKRSLKRLQSG